MKNSVVFITAILLIISICLPMNAATTAVPAKRPIILLFETTRGEGVDKDLASSTTRALKQYFRDTQRVEVATFDRESPTVLRAIMDKRLTADQVASYSSREERLLVAKVLSYDYASGAEISMKNGYLEVKLWVAKVDGGKRDSWEVSKLTLSMGSGTRDMDNAMQSAASATVIEIDRLAFMQLQRVAEPPPTTGKESTAIAADQVPTPTQPTTTNYAAQAEESIKSGNIALAIQQYTQAVNTDPNNADLRIKLADVYAQKGLYTEAQSELDRASQLGGSADVISKAKGRIDDLRNGQVTIKRDTSAKPESKPKSATATATASSVAKIVEGDKLWNQADPDGAADAYRESIKINPGDWRAYERLALVCAAMSMFSESMRSMQQLSVVQPNPTADVVLNRYTLLRKAFDMHFNSLISQYDSDGASFAKHSITHESYYNSIKGLSGRLEAMAKFLDSLAVPSGKEPTHLRRSLACGLMAQAASSMLDYLETNNSKSKANAEIFVAQAKKELETAAKLDSGASTASVTK